MDNLASPQNLAGAPQ